MLRRGVGAAARESYGRLFLRFLRFGCLAWGGPVAQIDMVRRELVEEERWLTPTRFNRVLAVYQALPGPEAHELCVYFGFVARGRVGGLLAGLGFMLPGFTLILALSWAYVRFGLAGLAPAGLFYGFQAAVLALIVRAIYGLSRVVLHDPWLWGIAAVATGADLLGVHFGVTLLAGGSVYAALRSGRRVLGLAVVLVSVVAASLVPGLRGFEEAARLPVTGATEAPTILRLFGSGLLAGLLTFGGAYTVIPFLRREAVVAGWMTNSQFVDGLALSGILPAPLVIFGTFVGYVGGGFPGALVLTAGIFLPAFSFTLLGHGYLERLIEEPRLHAFLDGVTAAVVGLITATTVRLTPTAIPDVPAGLLAVGALVALLVWRSRLAIVSVVLAAGGLGLLLGRM